MLLKKTKSILPLDYDEDDSEEEEEEDELFDNRYSVVVRKSRAIHPLKTVSFSGIMRAHQKKQTPQEFIR